MNTIGTKQIAGIVTISVIAGGTAAYMVRLDDGTKKEIIKSAVIVTGIFALALTAIFLFVPPKVEKVN